jgi:hypothetical protein
MGDISVWLVEYKGAKPCPVYATDTGFPTCDPWQAKRFDTKEAAEAWMTRPDVVGYMEPWAATSHGFSGAIVSHSATLSCGCDVGTCICDFEKD